MTEQAFREAYVHAERTLGKNPIIQPDFTFKRTLEEKIRIELEFLGKTDYLAVVVNDIYSRTLEETLRSREVLLQLKERYPMVLVSNFYGNIATVLKEFGLDSIFLHIIESAVVGVRKPDPRIFSMGVDALGMSCEDVVVVGDSIDKDIIPAKSIGCQTVWFKGEGWTDAPVDECIPDKIITKLNQIL